MSITTRNGYRKTLLAKKYVKEVRIYENRYVNLRDARKAIEVQQEMIKILKPLSQKQRLKVIMAVKIMLDLE